MTRRLSKRPVDSESIWNPWPSYVDSIGIAAFLFLIIGVSAAIKGEEASRQVEQVEKQVRQVEERVRQAEQRAIEFKEELEQSEAMKKAGIEITVNGSTLRVRLSDEVTFGSGRASKQDLSSTAQNALLSFATLLKSKLGADSRAFYVDVEGHADSRQLQQSRDKYFDNWSLSAERAITVVRFLESQCDIPGNSLHVSSYSFYEPHNKQNSLDPKNRRIELRMRFEIESDE